MLMSIGIDSIVLAREARNATRRAFAICSAVASTSPSTFFWFGQISTQTLNSMIVPSHAPTPINVPPNVPPDPKPSLHEVEVVEEPDPGDSREDVQPNDEAACVEVDARAGARDDERDYDRDHDSCRDGAFDGGQRVHKDLPVRSDGFFLSIVEATIGDRGLPLCEDRRRIGETSMQFNGVAAFNSA